MFHFNLYTFKIILKCFYCYSIHGKYLVALIYDALRTNVNLKDRNDQNEIYKE